MPIDPNRVALQIGKRIAELRRARGLSKGKLAVEVQTTAQWISQLELGKRSPTLHTLCKLANVLDVALVDLLGVPSRPRRPKNVVVSANAGVCTTPPM